METRTFKLLSGWFWSSWINIEIDKKDWKEWVYYQDCLQRQKDYKNCYDMAEVNETWRISKQHFDDYYDFIFIIKDNGKVID